jgi:uncharacterized protein YgiM (DUF1202 family)
VSSNRCILKQRSLRVSNQAKAGYPSSQRWLPALVFILTLTTLACALGTGSRSASTDTLPNRLPTLTRTPLPTLTPTTDPSAPTTPVAAAVAVVPPTLALTPTPMLPPPLSPVTEPVVVPGQTDGSAILTALVGINIRTGPGVDYPIVGKLTENQSAQIMGKNPEGTWWQIVYPPDSGNPAWVSGDTQYSMASNVEAVQIAQLPPPPPPTATPTNLPPAPPTPIPPPTGAAIAQSPLTPVPNGNPDGSPPATPIVVSAGWTFTNVRSYPNEDENSLVLYGNIVNNTGSLQELVSIAGTFYDEQGQVVAEPDNTHAYWPGYVVPPGKSVPFELFVEDVQSVADFELIAAAEPSGENPRQDFEFTDVGQGNENGAYCLKGELKIQGAEPEDYLIIAAVLYDGQGNVVNFGDYSEFGVDDDEVDFEICINPPNQEVARYDLVAWGL